MFVVESYVDERGRNVIDAWLDSLRDQRAQIAVLRRIARMEAGNFGDHKSLGEGVWELRIQFGPGLRMYYGLKNQKLILLVGGGDKSTQTQDIERAKEIWRKEIQNDAN